MIIDCYYFTVLISVCRSRVLMLAVQSGDVMKVDAILNSLRTDQTTDHNAGGNIHASVNNLALILSTHAVFHTESYYLRLVYISMA